MTNYITKRSHELATGDIVVNNGMRLLLGERHVSDAHGNTAGLIAEGWKPETYWFIGTILNVEEVNEAGIVPFSWRCETRPQYVGTEKWTDKGDKWQVQGNSRATWTVEA